MGLRDWWRSRRRPPPATPGGIGAPVVTPTEKATLPPSSKAVTPAQQQVPGRPSGGGGGSSRSPTPTIHQDLAGGTTTPTGTSISGTPQPGLSNAQLQAAARQQQQTPTPSAPSNAQLQDAARRRQVEQQGFVGGTAFLTKQEAARAGIVPTTAPQGTPKSLGQLQIEQTERELGIKQGSSGVVATTPRSRPDFKHQTKGDVIARKIERQVENVLFTPVLFPEGIRGGSLPPEERAATLNILEQHEFLGQGSSAIKTVTTFPVRHPVKTGVLVGVGIVAPHALGAVGKGVVAVSSPAIASGVGTTLGIGLTTYYTGTKIYQYKQADSPTGRGEVLGTAFSELALLGVGSRIGSKGQGFIKTAGKQEIKIERLVPEKVLSGKDRFPLQRTGGAKAQLKLFQQTSQRFPELTTSTQPISFHATGKLPKLTGGRFIVQEGFSSEFQGIYGSSSVSPHFLRVQTGAYRLPTSLQSFNIFNTYSDPTVLVIKPQSGFKVQGYKVIGVKPTRAVFTGQPPGGTGLIPGLKTEIEAINIPGTIIEVTSTSFRTTYGGVRVPIFQGVATGGGAVTSAVSSVASTSSSSAVSGGLSIGYAAFSSIIPTSSSMSSKGFTSDVYTTPSSSIPSSSPISSYIPLSSGGKSSGRSSPSRPSSPSFSSSPSSPISPPSSSYVSPQSSSYVPPSSSYAPSVPSSYKLVKPIGGFKLQGLKLPKTKLGKFTIFGKRFGKFKPVGTARTPSKAFKIGTGWASRTLGASFKIPGTKKRKIKGFRTKKTKEGIIYIEPKKRRLKKRGKSIELPEIQYWKRRKK